MNPPVQQERIKRLNNKHNIKGSYVIYWMQASQRSEYNHALEFAIYTANLLLLPVIVYFGLTDQFPEANERHYRFMLQGLKDTSAALNQRGILFILRHESPEKGIVELSRNASAVITDRGYLKIQKAWRTHVAASVQCPVIQVESDVIVPVEQASLKEEYSAATLRKKITKHIQKYIVPISELEPEVSSLHLNLETINLANTDKLLAKLNVDKSVKRSAIFSGGTSEAKNLLKQFIEMKLKSYAMSKSDPGLDYTSHLSPFLHFGQISPLFIALEVLKSDSNGKDTYLEELITRRELSMNFVNYNTMYDSFDSIPVWARKTFQEHEKDKRDFLYTVEEMENARTHDKYWNAAQREMTITGYMHGYMRMYWCKKIIEWSQLPSEAYRTALYLNNKYELDGRDPNGFTGIAWSFGKHDRPWATRSIFGNVRYMSSEGLKRKFDINRYVQRINAL